MIGLLPGSDPALKDEYVVLMGHLDHLGMRKNGKPGEDVDLQWRARQCGGRRDDARSGARLREVGPAPAPLDPVHRQYGRGEGPARRRLFRPLPDRAVANRIAAVVDLDMPLLLYRFTDVIAFGAGHSQVAETVARAAGEIGM